MKNTKIKQKIIYNLILDTAYSSFKLIITRVRIR
jgi:hypothetical protein